MDIRLNTFITLSKTKSYTKASKILNITQPAVSQHIKYLEDYYGVDLIEKNSRDLKLTEEGEILLKYAEQIELLYSSIENRLHNKSAIIKTYSIGASMTIGGYVLPPILGQYKKIYPNIDILLNVNNTEEILKSLVKESIDFGLVEGAFNRSKFKYKKFKEDNLVLAISPENKLSSRKEVYINELFSENLILMEKGSGTRELTEERFKSAGIDINSFKGIMEIGSISAIKSLVENNMGFSIISKETIKKELKSSAIKTMKVKNMTFNREFNFVYLKENSFMDEFINFCCRK
ncbi:MAG: LysR family transcriptional regulator [Bacillota bacterium]|nr:LysR family transcriptional regulator [Bacillota bacterium]